MVNVTVEPVTEAICFTSPVGRSVRANQELAVSGMVGNLSAVKSSAYCLDGLCLFHTTRPSADAQICPRPSGSVCHPAPDVSSRSTICPGANRAASFILISKLPLAASAARSLEPTTSLESRVVANRDGPMMTSGEGLGPTDSRNGLAPSVFASVVLSGPAPRKVMPLLISRNLPPLTRNLPAASWTTWPVGQASIAAWICELSSSAWPRGVNLAQIVDRTGMPPTPFKPGFQVVDRSSGRMPAPATVATPQIDMAAIAAMPAQIGLGTGFMCMRCIASRCRIGRLRIIQRRPFVANAAVAQAPLVQAVRKTDVASRFAESCALANGPPRCRARDRTVKSAPATNRNSGPKLIADRGPTT